MTPLHSFLLHIQTSTKQEQSYQYLWQRITPIASFLAFQVLKDTKTMQEKGDWTTYKAGSLLLVSSSLLIYGCQIYQANDASQKKIRSLSKLIESKDPLVIDLTNSSLQIHKQNIAKLNKCAISLLLTFTSSSSFLLSKHLCCQELLPISYELFKTAALFTMYAIGAHWMDGAIIQKKRNQIQEITQKLLAPPEEKPQEPADSESLDWLAVLQFLSGP